MNTSPINNPANLLQAIAATPGKFDADLGADADSFNQVLTREMSAPQDNAAAPAAPASQTASAAPSAAPSARPAQRDDGDDGDNTTTSQDDTTTGSQQASAADASKKTGDDDKVASGKDAKKGAGKDKDDDKKDAADPSGIAAFVAALTDAKAPVAQPVTTATAATTVTTAAAAVAIAPAAKAAATGGAAAKNDPTAVVAGKSAHADAAGTGADGAVGKKSDFVAALDKAGADAGNGTQQAATSAKAQADLAAAALQTVALPDGTTQNAGTPQTFAAAVAAAIVQPSGNGQSAAQSSALLPTVGGPGWDDALGQKIVWMAKGGEQTATLTLNPPDLGPMQVTVHVANNQATANFVAQQPDVRHALESSMPRLREMLNDAGIQLGQSNVHAGMPDQQGSFGESRQGGGGRRDGGLDGAVDAVSSLHVSHVPTPLGGKGMVDTFA